MVRKARTADGLAALTWSRLRHQQFCTIGADVRHGVHSIMKMTSTLQTHLRHGATAASLPLSLPCPLPSPPTLSPKSVVRIPVRITNWSSYRVLKPGLTSIWPEKSCFVLFNSQEALIQYSRSDKEIGRFEEERGLKNKSK